MAERFARLPFAAAQMLPPPSAATIRAASRPGSTAFKQEAAAQGISAASLAALDGVRYDQDVINADRRAGRLLAELSGIRRPHGRAIPDGPGPRRCSTNTPTLSRRIEAEFGVPGPVIVAFWGLETDFGANLGDFRTLQSLATLAYDCRRPGAVPAELLAALQILDRGDLTARRHGRRLGRRDRADAVRADLLPAARRRL